MFVSVCLTACSLVPGNNSDNSNYEIRDSGPVWSPDSRRIAFGSLRSGNDDIWVVNVDGTGLKNLTDDSSAADFHPRWSPDGTQIAIVSTRSGGDKDVWVMQSDGANPINLTYDNDGHDTSPTWSPDGTYIAFVSDRAGRQDIWLMQPDGSEAVNLTEDIDSSGFVLPSWLSNGQYLVFMGDVDGWLDIWVVSIDETSSAELTSDMHDTYAIGSPTDKTIVMHSRRSGNWDIWTIEADTLEVQNLTLGNEESDTFPAWSRDGKQIAYMSTANTNADPDVWIMDIDGTNKVNLTLDVVSAANPMWSPDGERIAFESLEGSSSIWVINVDGTEPVNLTGGQ